MSLFRSLGERVRQGLRRTRELMDEGLGAVLAIARPVDEAMLEELEETLIAADLGADLGVVVHHQQQNPLRSARPQAGGAADQIVLGGKADQFGGAIAAELSVDAGSMRIDCLD